MEKTEDNGNRRGRWAPLANLSIVARAIERAQKRSANLPGVVVVHARYGSGKSMALSYCHNEFEGFYLECQSHFSRKTFVQMVLKEMDIKPARTVGEMMEQVAEQLDKSTRPLILDDVHRITNKNVLGLVLDLHQSARTTIVLAGDDRFPETLRAYDEQLYSRVLVWQPVPLTSADDARKLAAFYVPGVHVDDDLLAHFREKTRNNARLICINLDHVRDYCQRQNVRKIDLDAWGKREIYTGDAPERKAA